MLQKKILVPIGTNSSDLKSIHYALSLAERIQARVLILQEAMTGDKSQPHDIWLKEALFDLMNSARQAGISVSYHIAGGELREDIIDLTRKEHIGVLVFGENDGIDEMMLTQLKTLVTSQIIQVKEKNHISYL